MSEANLTSHLTISFSPTPAASGSSAPAGSGAAASTQPDGAGPAGFLAALIDQLLAGAAATVPPAGEPAAASADAAPALPIPLATALDPKAALAARSSGEGKSLLEQLTRQLKDLKDELDTGETPDPELLEALGRTVDAIAALISGAAPAGTATPQGSAGLDPLTAIANGGGSSAASGAASSARSAGPLTAEQLGQYIAALGGKTAPRPEADGSAAPGTSAASDADPSAPLPGIARLADALAAASRSVAQASPDLAQKLAALGQQLESAEANPQLLAQLAAPGDSDASILDRTVQSLLDARRPSARAVPAAASGKGQTQAPSATIGAPALPVPAGMDGPAGGAHPAASGAKAGAAPATAMPRPDDAAPAADARIVAAIGTRDDSGPAGDTAQVPPPATAAGAAAPLVQAPPRLIPAAYQATVNPINMGQVAFEMIRQMHQGTSRFSIRLDPPELGRIDVKMHVDATGAINARLTVEKSETLDMFQRDRGTLEKALSQAGLDGAKTNLEFSLRQNPFAGMTGNFQRPSGGSGTPTRVSSSPDLAEDEGIAAAPSVTLYRGVASAGGVNIFV